MSKAKFVDGRGVVHLVRVDGQYLRLLCQPHIGRMNLDPIDDATMVTSCVPCLEADSSK